MTAVKIGTQFYSARLLALAGVYAVVAQSGRAGHL